MKLNRRIISLLLVSVIMISLISMTGKGVYRSEYNDLQYKSFLTSKAEDDVFLVKEVQSQRGKFEKHFLCSDGSFVAVMYPNAVHYLDDKNEWKEYDNSLKSNERENYYKTSNNGFSVSLSKFSDNDKLIVLDNKGIEISWTLSAIINSDTNKEYSTQPELNLSSKEIDIIGSNIPEKVFVSKLNANSYDSYILQNYNSEVKYDDVFCGENVTLKYSIDANRIKEDIILNEKNDIHSFIMNINTNGLNALLNANNEIELIDQNGITQYTIGAPCLIDAAFEYSYNIKIDIEQNDRVCKVVFTLDDTWINSNERVYPITFDPSVTTKEYESSVIDAFAWRYHYTDQSNKTYLDVGVDSGDPSWAFIKFARPNISDNYYITITRLALHIFGTYGSYSNNTINIYEALPWSTGANLQPLSSYLGNFVNTFNAGYSGLNSVVVGTSGDFCEDGYILKYADESNAGNTNYIRFYSSEATWSNIPYLLIHYTNAQNTSLPTSLVNGGVYALKNEYSGKYMTALSDNNNANIEQITIETPNNNQLFKIDLQTGTGGSLLRAMCSSNGNNRALDIQSQGAIPSNGHNIQIYTTGYPFAQEWIFVKLGSYKYKIVLRSNMNLCIAGTYNGDIKLQTYTGSNLQKWTMQYMGCRTYESTSQSNINCQGYAFKTNDWPDNWLNYSFSYMNAWTNENTALSDIKSQLENNWLDIELTGRWEDVTNNGGINALLSKNQWLVAMRVGIDDIYESIDPNASNLFLTFPSTSDPLNAIKLFGNTFYYKKYTYDYHFWYRDNTGQWVNKHGESPSQQLESDIPTDNFSPGWKLYNESYFYRSTIVYYRITIE